MSGVICMHEFARVQLRCRWSVSASTECLTPRQFFMRMPPKPCRSSCPAAASFTPLSLHYMLLLPLRLPKLCSPSCPVAASFTRFPSVTYYVLAPQAAKPRGSAHVETLRRAALPQKTGTRTMRMTWRGPRAAEGKAKCMSIPMFVGSSKMCAKSYFILKNMWGVSSALGRKPHYLVARP
eukprot:1150543-Pelagomonas_calceolata.AAC.5